MSFSQPAAAFLFSHRELCCNVALVKCSLCFPPPHPTALVGQEKQDILFFFSLLSIQKVLALILQGFVGKSIYIFILSAPSVLIYPSCCQGDFLLQDRDMAVANIIRPQCVPGELFQARSVHCARYRLTEKCVTPYLISNGQMGPGEMSP